MKKNGFTLVELSIVLVILGLLIGGVLTGQSLIRAAELRSVTTQQARWVTATQTFRDKYLALPGDITNATSYWGAQASGTSCVDSASTDAKTCNGDGNGQIDFPVVSVSTSNEMFRFWQHLANAGLIEGNYSGAANATYEALALPSNAPAGRISGSLWWVTYWGAISGGSYGAYDGQYGNIMQMGMPSTTGSPLNAAFKAEELYNIDMKVDDGKPATGKVGARMGGVWVNTACVSGTSSADLTGSYNLSNTATNCTILFRQVF